jgi:hypothetical protein
MTLRQSAEEYVRRTNDALDDLFVAIETRDTSKQHTALAALIRLLEMLKSELEHGKDDNGEEQ